MTMLALAIDGKDNQNLAGAQAGGGMMTLIWSRPGYWSGVKRENFSTVWLPFTDSNLRPFGQQNRFLTQGLTVDDFVVVEILRVPYESTDLNKFAATA